MVMDADADQKEKNWGENPPNGNKSRRYELEREFLKIK
jgi:hypothetical protein